jgi:hypothetical protein
MVWVTNPLDKIFEVVAVAARVEDAFDFILHMVIDGDREGRRDRGRAVRVRGRAHIRAEDGDMEDGVDAQGVRESEFVGDGGDDLRDGVGTNEPGLEFLRGTGSLGSKINMCRR